MHVLLLTLALATPPQHPDTAVFITRLGADTLAVERFVLDGRTLDGVSTVRSPSLVIRRYHAALGAHGLPDTLTLMLGSVGRPVEQTLVYIVYTDDSVQVVTRLASGIKQKSVAAAGRPLPFSPDMFGPWEVALRAALATGTGDVRMPMSVDETVLLYDVHRAGGDTLQLRIGNSDYGPLSARMDATGRLQTFDLRATTDKFLAERVSGLDVDSMTAVFAARELAGKGLGSLSPRDTARAIVGGVHVQIDYGRPMRRGRTIFGNVVPWDTVWRTGANQATQLITDKDLVIGGTTVPAGTYSLFTIPSPKGWQLIINTQHGQWGTDYDAKQDLARIPMRAGEAATPVERLTLGIRGSTMSIAWDRAEASVEVKQR
jgi:DUF2911 family protein